MLRFVSKFKIVLPMLISILAVGRFLESMSGLLIIVYKLSTPDTLLQIKRMIICQKIVVFTTFSCIQKR